MFSRYKKTDAAPAAQAVVTPIAVAKPEAAAAASMRRAAPAAAATPVDKEVKRKQRMGEIKLDLHRVLLDNLNLAALEHASEADLRAEINAISTEHLNDNSIVLGREDRIVLNTELMTKSQASARSKHCSKTRL